MKICAEVCNKNNKCCDKKECRMWIDYEEDLNCTEIAVKKNGAMTLKEVGRRLGVSYVRVSQLEKDALNKVQKNSFNKTRH
jgi:DNA-directed RNA polymerase specialized sigma subunit